MIKEYFFLQPNGRYIITSIAGDYTHVLEDKDTFFLRENELKNVKGHIDKMKNEKEILEKQLENKIEKHRIEIENLKFDYEKKLSAEKNLNRNLIRISKERANSSRDIKNKKTHTGYILISVNDYVLTKNEGKNIVKIPCFFVKMQTPYNISFSKSSIVKLVLDDFSNQLNQKMGLEYGLNMSKLTIQKMSEFFSSENKSNFFFDIEYELNAIRGFWEIKFKTRGLIKRNSDFLVCEKSSPVKSSQVQNQN